MTLKGRYFVEGNITITYTLQLDGTELVIPVPANAEKGFMVLESGEATRQ